MKLFIWDFHGVLEKGNDKAVHEITNQVLEKRGYACRMTMHECEQLSGRHWHEYFAYLMPDLDKHVCLKLQADCYEISQNSHDMIARHIELNDHAEFVLESIQKSPYMQILISNAMPEHLDTFVKMVGIEKYFPMNQRFGVNPQHHKSQTKKDCLHNFLEDKHFPEGIVSIGDSPHDVALVNAHPKGVGYLYVHPGRNHRTADCHYKINDLRQILQEIA